MDELYFFFSSSWNSSSLMIFIRIRSFLLFLEELLLLSCSSLMIVFIMCALKILKCSKTRDFGLSLMEFIALWIFALYIKIYIESRSTWVARQVWNSWFSHLAEFLLCNPTSWSKDVWLYQFGKVCLLIFWSSFVWTFLVP